MIRGGKPLVGSVTVSGAKNAALPAMAAVLLTSEELMLENVPSLQDVATIERLLGFMGVESREAAPGTVGLTSRAVRRFEVPYDLVRTMRASVLVLGPLLARFGKARVSLPGGCAIGPRPINLHLAGLGWSRGRRPPGTVGLTSRAVRRFEVPYDLVRTMRASVLVLGPLLARFGKARVSLP